MPATITSAAQALTKPTAAPGASGRPGGAGEGHRERDAGGEPDDRRGDDEHRRRQRQREHDGAEPGDDEARGDPARGVRPAQQRTAATRVKKPSTSVSEPTRAAELFECPWCSSSVTTQFPTITLKPNDIAWIAANR